MSVVLKLMKKYGIPMTRKNYLDVEFMGKPHKPDPETEAEIPDEPRFQAFRPVTHEEVAAEEAEKGSKKPQ